MNTENYPRNYWKGFIALFLAYSLLQLFYYLPTTILPNFLKRWPLSPLWIMLVSVYVMGALILRGTDIRWLAIIWHIVHITLATFALTLLAYGRFIGPLPLGLGTSFRPIIEFLISPIPYMAIGLLYRATRTMNTS